MPNNIIRIYLWNFAEIYLKRRDDRRGVRHEFEYWGHEYTWMKYTKQEDGFSEERFLLFDREEIKSPIAFIVPKTSLQSSAEVLVPAHCMWTSNESIPESVTDLPLSVYVSTLISLYANANLVSWLPPDCLF